LVQKVSDIVYKVLKEEPYFGMYSDTGKELADYIAEAIIRNSEMLYR